jgi:hypothetical protein
MNSAWRRLEFDVWGLASGIRYVSGNAEEDVDNAGRLVFSVLHKETKDILDSLGGSGGARVGRKGDSEVRRIEIVEKVLLGHCEEMSRDLTREEGYTVVVRD